MTPVITPSLRQARRLVIKIGSALLVDEAAGAIQHARLAGLAEDVVQLRRAGAEVMIVTSGAIAVGRRHLGFPAGPLKLEEKQAAAACGQVRLAHAYLEALAAHQITAAQILLTIDDTEERRRYLNARNTINTLLAAGAVPIINENDTVATAEIRFGDNDRLAARVAAMMSADTLLLLSTIDGMYSADPSRDSTAEWIPRIDVITPEIEAAAGAAGSADASGGMLTKLAAARIAMAAGCHMVIARGDIDRPVAALQAGARCTWFVSKATPRAARKHWIAGSLQPRGTLTIDAGAEAALLAGRSLLPAGVGAVEGDFERGEAVTVRGAGRGLIGRGLCAYSAADARRIMGHKTGEIERILGYRGRDAIIHRDDLVLEESA
ncbi:MAG: glutamate 5-kinase [Proteobacteria bacterium]|nr:glutamate 5-kinase [Pseudomonadota bacterium]MDA1355439.1 glutamate 5-kinase [Pseudomonadota bacterium]